MKRILVLTLALWTGLSNFAYAQARIECTDMMNKGMTQSYAVQGVTASHSCHSVPCQCAIEMRSNEQSEPSSIEIGVFRIDSAALISADAITAIKQSTWTHPLNFSPPEKPPLYTLFSVYRI